MGELTDKLDAAGNKIAGNVKEAAGKATDNDKLVAERSAQKLNGTGQDVKGSVKAHSATTFKTGEELASR
jgi:uncharacterized protein YjbJ (UPF0337 family)